MPVQTATIVVTDLVASTPLRTALGEERADEVRRAHDRALTRATEGAGGTVVKHLGDGVLAVFAGSAEALVAAVAMQQALELVGREEAVELAMRVGVSAGDVTLEEGDAFGTPVVEASRLCGAAGGGQILVAEQVRLLARGRGRLQLDPVGSLELRGLPEPIAAYSLRWAPARTRGDLRGETPFVGRAHERALLRERMRAAAEGVGGLVLVAGEPGIGKTRFLRELCREAEQTTVLWGGCHEGDALAYAPFVEALTGWARAGEAATVARLLRPDAAELARLTPVVRELVPDAGEAVVAAPDEAVAQLLDAVNQFLARLAGEGPVVFVLDDLHWADDAVIAMLRSVVRPAARLPLLVVGIYRETDLDRRHPLAHALPLLRRETDVMRVALDGLESSDIHRLLEELTGQAIPEDFSSAIARHTDGNPFFVRETLLDLVESRQVRFEDGTWVVNSGDLGIPEGVREVIGRRLSQLSVPANQLLHAAALFDAAFPLAVAASVAQLSDDDALDALDESLAARVLRPSPTVDHYVFTHALFRQTLAEELNPSRQVRMHRAIADALEQHGRGEVTPELAATLTRHFERSAALPGAERGARYARIVAEDAASRFAYRRQYDALSVARELDPEGADAELWAAIARAACVAQLAPDVVADECEQAGRTIAAAQGHDAAADILTEALDAGYQLLAPDVRWRLAAIVRRWLRPERRDVTWVSLRVLELNERDLTDPEYPGVIVDDAEWTEARSVALSHYGDPRLVNTSRYIGPVSRREFATLPERGPEGYRWSLRAFGSFGDFGVQLQHMLEDLDRQETRRNLPRLVLDLALAARLERALGRHDDGDAHLDEAVALVPRLAPESNEVFQVFSSLAMRSYVCGDDVALITVDELERMAENPDTRWAATVVRAGKAVVLAREGAADEAVAAVEACLPGIERAPGWAVNYPLIVGFAAEALFTAGRTDHLATIERNVLTKVIEPDFRYPEVDGRWSMARLCAVAGRAGDARRFFDDARATIREQGLVPLLVNVDFDEATMEARLGNVARARELLARARAGCNHRAMSPWFGRIDRLERSVLASQTRV